MLPNNDQPQINPEEKPKETKKVVEPLTAEQLKILKEKYGYQYPDDPRYEDYIRSQVSVEK